MPRHAKAKSAPAQQEGEGQVKDVNLDNKPLSKKSYLANMSTYLEGRKRNIKGFTVVNPEQVYRFHKQILHELTEGEKALTVPNSIKSHLEALVHYLKLHQLETPNIKGLKELIESYSGHASDLDKLDKIDKKDNLRAGKRAQLEYQFSDLVNGREELLKNFDDLNVGDHMNLLILALSTYQAPLRAETSNMKIVKEADLKNEKKSSLESEDEDQVNFLVMDVPNPYFYMTDFKTSKKFKNVKIFLVRKLSSLIKRSLVKLPREWLLVGTRKNQPMRYQSWRKRVIDLIGDVGGQADILRGLYVSEFSKVQRSENEWESLARSMLTSVGELRTSYQKLQKERQRTLVDDDDEPEEIELAPAVVKQVEKPVVAKPASAVASAVASAEDQADAVASAVAEKKAERLEKMRRYNKENKERIQKQNNERYLANKEEIAKQKVIRRIREDRALGEDTVRRSTWAKYGITEADL